MKPTPKRTSTQPGLGRVSGEVRDTTKRDRLAPDADPIDLPPISAPPPSGPLSGAPPPRQTRALESEGGVERTPSPPPGSVRGSSRLPALERLERIALDVDRPPASVRGAASSRAPIEVTQVDTKRIPRAALGARPSDVSDGRFPTEEPTGKRPIGGRARADEHADRRTETSPSGSRTVDGRPLGKRVDSARPDSGRPASARPDSGRSIPVRPTAGGATFGTPPLSSAPTVARSARMSIREDNVGAALMTDAIRASSRAVPKLIKTKAEIAAAPIDHRAGFLLAHIDGVTSVAGLVDISGMPEDQVNDILDRLRRLGIVALR